MSAEMASLRFRPEVLRGREQFRVAGPAVLCPSLVAEWEDRYPFLGDDLFEVCLLVPLLVPGDPALGGLGGGAVLPERVDVLRRSAGGVGDVGLGSGRAPLGEREADAVLVIFPGLGLVTRETEVVLREQEADLGGVHPKDRAVGLHDEV